MNYFGATKKYVPVKTIHWPNGKKPVDLPHCGFDGALCPGQTTFMKEVVIYSFVQPTHWEGN